MKCASVVRVVLRRLSLALILLVVVTAASQPNRKPSAPEPHFSAREDQAEAAAFATNFLKPPAENRILKIIHSWPDESAAQDLWIRSLSTQGFGGVVCNVSFTDYLQSETRWKAFTHAVNEAKKAGFALWLYDEKGYPSATAGGLTLRDHPEWEARGLLIADTEVEDAPATLELPPGKPRLVAAFPIREDRLDVSRMTNLATCVASGKLSWQPPPGHWRVLAITEGRLFDGTHAALSLADHIPYPNLLDAEPTARFLELTHDAYAKHLGADLGRFFVSTFTDEPSLMSLFLKPMPYRVLPWSTNLPACFRRRHGYSVEDKLPALVADTGPETARVRYDFWHTIGELVAENYFGQIQSWCGRHQVLSGGHLLMEENLVNHVPLYGDFFRCLRRLDAPSIDCLTSIPEQVPWFIARLAGSVAALENRRVTMCETSDHAQRYRPAGDKRPVRKVTEPEIRGTCNRLMVAGINTITSYYSFDGLGGPELRRLNEWVGRCACLLRGGHQVADLAVLFPVESLWPRFTPARHYANDSASAAAIEQLFHDTSESLFAANRDFTYVDGRALAEAKVENGALVHGPLRWRAVILPGADTLPLAAWENLRRFVAGGGVLISIGALPSNSETEFPSPKVQRLAADLFGAGAIGEPRVSPSPKGGGAVFLPVGAAPLLPTVIDGILEPDVKVEGRPVLRATHRRMAGRDTFFVINDSPEPWKGKISFCIEGAGEQCGLDTGRLAPLAAENDIVLELPAYGASGFRFATARLPKQSPLTSGVVRALRTSDLSRTEPLIARGEFVREELTPLPAQPGAPFNRPAWRAAATLTKSGVDTFLFVRFPFPEPLDLRGVESLVLETGVPDRQRTPNQLLLILHEKGGADYLAHTGRLLNSPGRSQTWVPLKRLQLAGWSQDANGRLDPDSISEIRIGWGGYLGKEGEKVEFSLSIPKVASAK